MNQDEILFSLNPQRSICDECAKYYHHLITRLLLKKIGSLLADDLRCIKCGWSDLYLYDRLVYHNISLKEMEESYGNIYEIKFREKKFVFIKKEI